LINQFISILNNQVFSKRIVVYVIYKTKRLFKELHKAQVV